MYLKSSLVALVILATGILGSDDQTSKQKKPKANARHQNMRLENAKRAHVDLVIFSCTVDRDKAHLIAPDNMKQAIDSSATLFELLNEWGEAEYVQRVSQPIAFSGETFNVTSGANLPFVRGTTITRNGQSTAAIEYEQVGTDIKLSGKWNESDPLTGTVQVEMEIADVRSSKIPLGGGHEAPVITQIDFELDSAFKVNKGRLFVIGGPPTMSDETTSVLVGRLEVSF